MACVTESRLWDFRWSMWLKKGFVISDCGCDWKWIQLFQMAFSIAYGAFDYRWHIWLQIYGVYSCNLCYARLFLWFQIAHHMDDVKTVVQRQRDISRRIIPIIKVMVSINPSVPAQNGGNFTDHIFKIIFMNGKFYSLIRISMKFVPVDTLVQIMTQCWTGIKPLSELIPL